MITITKNIIYKIADYVLALVLGNFGLLLIKKEFWPSGISLTVAAFLLLYFSSYTSQINKNETELIDLKNEFSEIKQKIEINEIA